MCALVLCLLFCFQVSFAAGIYGADVSSPVSEEAWRCLKSQHGVDFAVARAFTSTGSFDSGCVGTVANARKAGLSPVDVYFFPAYHHLHANASVDLFHKGMTGHGVHADKGMGKQTWRALRGNFGRRMCA
jgi:hypothetical protein